MSQKHPPLKDTQERNVEITLFRYSLIGTQLFDPLTAGRLEQALRARTYSIPRSSRTWVRVYPSCGVFSNCTTWAAMNPKTPGIFARNIIRCISGGAG